MSDQFSNTQQIRKPAVTSKGGIVAAQSGKAAQVGAEVLAAGGDCVDAVIATTFALGVLEPWMSGLGGGGAMVLYRANEDRYEVIDYGMRAPRSLRIEDYPLTGDGAASDLFPVGAGQGRPQYSRPRLDRGARRGCGHGGSASPPRQTAVEGIAGAERHACRRRPRRGLVDHADDRKLGCGPAALPGKRRRLSRRRPAAERAVGHQVPACACRRTGSRRRWRNWPPQGPRDFYEGDLAKSIAADMQAAGGALSVEDLAPFRAHRARAAGDPLSRRQGVRDAGTHRRTDTGAHACACCRTV